MGKNLLLINPWIYDFAACDLWIKPLGLLQIASILEKNGYGIDFIDCMDRFHPGFSSPKPKKYGCGKYHKEILEKPSPIKDIPRFYGRYGIFPEIIRADLARLNPPEAILVTSGMTYWYPGAFEVINIARHLFPGVPIILGGIYASLCFNHAKEFSGADLVLAGADYSHIIPQILEFIESPATEIWLPPTMDELPYPAYHLLSHNSYICLQTSRGCPFSCSYCASNLLHSGFEQQTPKRVLDEIIHFHEKYRIKNFTFYDDALLVNAESHIIPVLDEVIERKMDINFHTPNAMHARYISKNLAQKMFKSGFKTIMLGLETSNIQWQKSSGGKVNNSEFETAIENLKSSGFSQTDLGVYILIGLPGQKFENIAATLDFVYSCGAKPVLTEYSPLPGTRLFQENRASYPDAEHEPLLQNNSLAGYNPPRADILKTKELVKKINSGFDRGENRVKNIYTSSLWGGPNSLDNFNVQIRSEKLKVFGKSLRNTFFKKGFSNLFKSFYAVNCN